MSLSLPRIFPRAVGLLPARARRLPLLLCACLAAVHCPAQDRPDGGNVLSRMGDDLMGMTDFFETVLPGTLKKYNLVLDFSPKFGDVRNREFIRYPIGLRYGVAQDWELYGGLTPFSPNPINSGVDHRWGPGEARFGFRHNTRHGFLFYQRATFGVECRVPLGEPPVDLIDGYSHVKPFLTVSRDLHWPSTQLYTTFSYDRAMQTTGRDRPTSPRVVRQHIGQVAPGFLYKPGEYGWFTEYEFRHLDEDIGYRLSHGVRVGVIWDMPRAKSQRFHLPGKWQIEMALKLVKEEGRSLDPGVVTRVRVRTTLREVLTPERVRAGLR